MCLYACTHIFTHRHPVHKILEKGLIFLDQYDCFLVLAESEIATFEIFTCPRLPYRIMHL